MFFNKQGIIDIDEMVAKEPSFQKIMDDDIVTDDLLKQSQLVIDLLHETEQRFSENDQEFIKRLFVEANVLSTVYHIHSLQNIR